MSIDIDSMRLDITILSVIRIYVLGACLRYQ